MKGVTVERDIQDLTKVNTLGSVRLHHVDTKEIILIPTPSEDPKDPLTWSKGYRNYIAVIVCAAMFFCNFLAAGPTVAIVDITIDFFGPPGPTFGAHIAKIAYFFTSTALLQGMGNLVWMPLIIKYGRRPVYLASFTIYTATAIWAGVSTTYASELAARIIMGFAAGSGECLAPLTISDTFFLHERGSIMAFYTAALSTGVSGGIIIAGLITISHSWRYIYYVATALIGALTVLVFFTMPETSFDRNAALASQVNMARSSSIQGERDVKVAEASQHIELGTGTGRPKQTFADSLRVYHGTFTKESLFKLFVRPILLLVLPPVLWATLVMSVTIGFLVAISSNFASAFTTTYGFKPYQSGLCFFSGLIGSLIGIACGGWLSDVVANYFTRRNGGIREPEMRLPALCVSLVASPLALVLYGVGIQHQLHWMVPTLGLGLLSFAIVQATNVTLVYTIDAYRPVAGEVVVTQLAFKAAFGFLLSFYTNPWIAKSGYQDSFGAMAGISAAILILWVPFYFFGKQIRQTTFNWGVMRSIQWNEDREVGE